MTGIAIRPVPARSQPARVACTVNGVPVSLACPGDRRLLDVLRVDLGLTGAKEGCGEGECGACAVIVDGALVNSCLVPVGQVSGAEIRTVEGLADDIGLDPLQQAFLELGGTQCGACAPGLLLAAHAHLAHGGATDDDGLRAALAGNLCRCTGYTKVLEAVTAGAARLEPAAFEVPREHRVHRPVHDHPGLARASSLEDALRRLDADPSLVPIAGGTDLMVERAAGGDRRPLLDISGVAELGGLRLEDGQLVIGALTTWESLRTDPLVQGVAPVLAQAAGTVAAPAIRNRGTVGGSCVTASPAGDLAPVLLVLDAVIEVASAVGRRSIPASDFWTGYRQTAMRPGELLTAIRVPAVTGRHARFRKVAARRAMAIAVVSVAVAWTEVPSSTAGPSVGPWTDVRVAMGSMAPRPLRLLAAEAALEGRAPASVGAETAVGADAAAGVAALAADAAAATVTQETSPIDDVRAPASYRRAVAARALRRIVLDAAQRA